MTELVWHPELVRPRLEVEILETGWQPWFEVFRYHHYLHDAGRMPFSTAFTGFDLASGDPVCFVGVSGMVAGASGRAARACRLVVAPEYQGAGVGLRFLEAIATREARGEGFIGKPVATYIHTAHPALCAALRRSTRWKQVSQQLSGQKRGVRWRTSVGYVNAIRDPSKSSTDPGRGGAYGAHSRAVAGFRFRGVLDK